MRVYGKMVKPVTIIGYNGVTEYLYWCVRWGYYVAGDPKLGYPFFRPVTTQLEKRVAGY